MFAIDGTEIEVTLEWSYTDDQSISMPVIADLDGDGSPEVAMAATQLGPAGWPDGELVVLDGTSGAVKWRVAHDPANGSFGLATIRKSDITIDGSRLIFDYVGKGGARRVHEVQDPRITPLLGRMKRRRGGGVDLLAYREDGRWRDVRSGDVNTYLKGLLGPDHSAKDFRTWHATMLAAIDIARVQAELDPSKASRRRAIVATVARVAEHMGNTPAVCRASYIDPRVFDRFKEGRTIAPALTEVALGDDEAAREPVERAVLDLLAGDDEGAVAA